MTMFRLLFIAQAFVILVMQHAVSGNSGLDEVHPTVVQTFNSNFMLLECPPGYKFQSGQPYAQLSCGVNKWDGDVPMCQGCPQDHYPVQNRCARCPDHSHTTGVATSLSHCVCDQGYTLQRNRCVDMNECALNGGKGPCKGSCQNTDGGYKCTCPTPGHAPDPNDPHGCIVTKTCRPLNKDDAPENGGLVCHHFAAGNSYQCAARCNAGFDFPERVNNYEACGPTTGYKWTYQYQDPSAVLTPCITAFFPGFQMESKRMYFTNDCAGVNEKEKSIRLDDFVNILNEGSLCRPKTCKSDNVSLVCGAVKK